MLSAVLSKFSRVRRLLSRALAVGVAMWCAINPIGAQQATIVGTVLIEPSGKPLANAEILLATPKRSTRSDSAGNFILSGLPAGKFDITVRLVGYATFNASVSVGASDRFEADFLLAPISTKLPTVEVKAAAPYALKLAEFEERRKLGSGRFLTADVFEPESGRPLSSFLAAHIPGIKIVGYNGERILASARGGRSRVTTNDPEKKYPPLCYMRVVLNGIVAWDGSPGQEMFDMDRWVNTADVIGFEFHTVATTPLQYNRTAGTACGTVIIWTK